jgi:hypothetical protein
MPDLWVSDGAFGAAQCDHDEGVPLVQHRISNHWGEGFRGRAFPVKPTRTVPEGRNAMPRDQDGPRAGSRLTVLEMVTFISSTVMIWRET